jgi:beta-lactamase superfamily II metal-dependent hydrolase
VSRGRTRSKIGRLIAGIGVLLAWQAPQQPQALELIFLDVGQGDALIVRSPEGRVALIDAGRGWLIGQLGVHGIDTIDVAIATHPHADHIGGMVDVLHDLPVQIYVDNGIPHTTAIYAQVMAALEGSKAGYVVPTPPTITTDAATPPDSSGPHAGLTTIALGSVALEIWAPNPEASSLNDGSLAVLIRYGAFSALVTGDAEIEALNYFMGIGVPEVTVLKASHHGSRNGVSPAWVGTTRPSVVVISVGKDNGYGHPHAWAVEYYKAVADEIYRTDLHGEITIVGATDGTYSVQTVWGDRFARSSGETHREPVAGVDDASHIELWVNPDALGYDQFNLNGEYVVIKNNRTSTIDIGSWRLCNIERMCFTFPAGASIAAGDSVIVHSGVGAAQPREFYMRRTRPVWNDETGRAVLFDRKGGVIARYAY